MGQQAFSRNRNHPGRAVAAGGDGGGRGRGPDRCAESLCHHRDGTLGWQPVAFSIGIPKAELFARSDRAFFHTLTYFGIVLVLTLAAAFVVAEYSIRRRVAALADASERLAAGDLSARSGLPPSADELGALANSFDAMAQAMQRQIEDIRCGEEEIRALNADLERRVAERTAELEAANRGLE